MGFLKKLAALTIGNLLGKGALNLAGAQGAGHSPADPAKMGVVTFPHLSCHGK